MSNTEPDVGGVTNMFRGLFNRNTQINAMAGSEIKIAGLEDATRQMSELNNELKGLVTSLTGLSQQQAQLTQGISATMKTISTQAQQTTTAVSGATESVSRFRSGAMSIAGVLGSAVNSNFVKDLAMFPLRYITSATEQARNLGMGVSTSLGGQMYATGQSQADLMQQMSRFPGGVRGGVEDIIGLTALMRQYGAMADFSNTGGQQNPRAVGFLRGVSEMQAMSPGTPVAQLAQTVGGYASNTMAQQQSAYLTGGAFAMIGAGGRQKSVSEWAEGILKWLQDQRPGDMRGKGFEYGELLAQQFPGSNIDAWLSMQGVPDGMKEAFWNYALAKSRMTGSTSSQYVVGGMGGMTAPFKVEPVNTTTGGNQAWGRLNAATAQARGQFQLGGQLTGMFSNKETANQWFNEIIAQIMSQVIPAQIAGGSLQAMGVMPDPIQELLMTFLERSGTIGAALGGYIGYGTSVKGVSGISDLFKQLFAGGLPAEALGASQEEQQIMLQGFSGNPSAAGISDLLSGAAGTSGMSVTDWLKEQGWDLTSIFGGDVGDAWTSRGTSSTAGLHPTVRRGVERMMGDNPNIRVTSGLRDTVQQRRLRAAGNSNVSGKPSAHTRGLAADLGPRSQYGWISANASKYGLKSGITHGEPWHVGLPGIGDIGDPGDSPPSPIPPPSNPDVTTTTVVNGKTYIWNPRLETWTETISDATANQMITTGIANLPATTATLASDVSADSGYTSGLGSLFSMFKEGFSKSDAVSAIGSLVPTLLNLFLGTFGMGQEAAGGMDLSSIAYDPGLYAALRRAALGPKGIISMGGAYRFATDLNKPEKEEGGESDKPAGADGWRNTSGVLPSEAATFFNSDDLVKRAAATAAALKAANFGSDAIESLTKISWRESRWDPGAHRSDKHKGDWRWGDRGLFQINAGENQPNGTMDAAYKSAGIIKSSEDLKDPVINAKAAGYLSKMGADLSGWGMGPNGWVAGGDPFFGTSGGAAEAEAGLALAKSKGWIGDVDTAAYSMDSSVYPTAALAPAAGSNGKVIMFNNTFNISGGGGGGQGGGIDIRRTVAALADQLEGEMKKRLARSN